MTSPHTNTCPVRVLSSVLSAWPLGLLTVTVMSAPVPEGMEACNSWKNEKDSPKATEMPSIVEVATLLPPLML